MNIQDVRDTCYEVKLYGQEHPNEQEFNTSQSDMVLGMMIAVGSTCRGLCFSCKGCEQPLCTYQGMWNDVFFQFRWW